MDWTLTQIKRLASWVPSWLEKTQGLLKGVGGRLAASFFAVALVVLIPSLVWFYYYAQDLTEQRIQELLTSVLVHESNLLAQSIENRDHWQLYRLVRSMARPAHILSVALVDEQGNLLAHSDSSFYGRKTLPPITDNNYERIPLEGMRGLVGELVIHKNSAQLKAYFEPVKRAILLISGVFALLAGLLGILMAVFWRNRLRRILNQMQDAPGSLLTSPSSKQELSPSKGDELDQLERHVIASFEQLHIAQWILDSIRESVILVDLSGQVHHANAAAQNLCACGKCYQGLLQLIDKQTTQPFWQGESGAVKVKLQVCDSSFPALLSFRHYVGKETGSAIQIASSTNNNTQARMVVTITDLTDYQRLEGRLEKLRALSLLGEMSTELTHEIRNNLAPVKLLCEVSGMAAEDKQVVTASLNRIDDMIGGFMSFVRDGQQAASQECLQLVLEDVCKVLASLAAQRQVTLHLQAEPAAIQIALGAFNLSVINLIRNAIQVSQAGGQVWISAAVEANTILIQVADNGPGINPEIAEQIFEPFVSQRSGGTGMGLALVLRHVDEVGGKISHTPRAGGGTVFSLHWPAGINNQP